MKRILFLFALLFSMSFNSYGMLDCGGDPCPPGKICIDGSCRNNSAPPPPGLVVPIDNHLSLLIVAGLSLGIYFFASAGKKTLESR